jgi:hypothetical protein
MNNNMNITGEGGEMVTKRIRNRRNKPTPNAFEDAESPATAAPIQSMNSTYIANNLNNVTLGNSTNSNTNTYSESDLLWTVLCPIFLLLFCMFGHRAHVPSSQYHRGAMIRRQAERVWAIQAIKNERQAIPIETRKSQINKSLRRMKIKSKCSRTGHCILVSPEVEEQKDDEDTEESSTTTGEETKSIKAEGLGYTADASSASSKEMEAMSDASSMVTENEVLSLPPSNTAAAASSSNRGKKCPESPGRIERRPLLSPDSEDSEDRVGSVDETKEMPQLSSNNSAATAVNTPCYDGFDDDEDVCPICLDNFEVGEIVMWSRYNHGSCSHVFHEDCLLQWLLEQRENECPTCRACFIADLSTNSITSSSSSTTDTYENSILEPDETENNSTDEETTGHESSGDIEEGDGNSTGSNNIIDDDNNRGDCSFDLDEMRDQEHNFVDGKDENNSLTIDNIDEMEEGFTYIIVKGSVKRMLL